PLLERFLLRGRQRLVRLRRRHPAGRRVLEDALDELALVRLARDDGLGPERLLPAIEAQTGLAGGTVGTVATEAVRGEDGPHGAVELDRPGAGSRGKPRGDSEDQCNDDDARRHGGILEGGETNKSILSRRACFFSSISRPPSPRVRVAKVGGKAPGRVGVGWAAPTRPHTHQVKPGGASSSWNNAGGCRRLLILRPCFLQRVHSRRTFDTGFRPHARCQAWCRPFRPACAPRRPTGADRRRRGTPCWTTSARNWPSTAPKTRYGFALGEAALCP